MDEQKGIFSRKGVTRRFVERTLRGDKLNQGAYMWAIQRITGLTLFGFFILHLTTLGTFLAGPEAFDRTMELMRHPVIRVLELLLLGVAAFHALNGVRLILLNLFLDINQKVLSYCFSAAAIVFMIISIPFMW